MVNIKMVVKMRKYIIFILIIGLIISFIIGLYMHRLSEVDEKIAFEAEYKNVEEQNIIQNVQEIIEETSNTGIKTSPNTKVIEKKYYNDCDHLIQTEIKMKEKLVNKNEAEFQIEYIGWEIQKFTPNEVIIYKEIYDFCDEHFLLKDVEGEIMIYSLDKYGNEKEFIRETGIQTKYLPETDIENLKNGIKVYGNLELNQLLEDFE